MADTDADYKKLDESQAAESTPLTDAGNEKTEGGSMAEAEKAEACDDSSAGMGGCAKCCACLGCMLVTAGLFVMFYWFFGRFSCGPASLDQLKRLKDFNAAHWNVTVDGDRSWFTYTPPTVPEEGATVVVELHGNRACAYSPIYYSGFYQLAKEKGFIAVWPQGSENNDGASNVGNRMTSWNSYPSNKKTRRNVGATRADVDDVAFLGSVIDRTTSPADLVYMTGQGNGCFMAQRYAAQRTAGMKLTAMGCMSGDIAFPIDDTYQPVPIMIVRGENDDFLPFEGGRIGSLGLDAHSAVAGGQVWADANGAGPATTSNETDYSETNWAGPQPVRVVAVAGISNYPYLEDTKLRMRGMGLRRVNNRRRVNHHNFLPTLDTTAMVWDFWVETTEAEGLEELHPSTAASAPAQRWLFGVVAVAVVAQLCHV